MRSSLSSKKIAALKPREKRFAVADGHGLCLRVYPSGVKSWYLRISYSGRVTDIALGRWPEISLMQARQEARRRRKTLGLEPPRGYVLNDAFKLWCGLKKGRIVSYADERRRLERYLIKPLGRRQIDEISAPLVITTVKHIEAEGHQATLKRVLMRTREILDLAVCAGYIHHNPCERLSRVFAAPVVTPMPAPEWHELPNIMQVMKSAPVRMRILFLFSTCSMLRPGENAKLKRSWIDGFFSFPVIALFCATGFLSAFPASLTAVFASTPALDTASLLSFFSVTCCSRLSFTPFSSRLQKLCKYGRT